MKRILSLLASFFFISQIAYLPAFGMDNQDQEFQEFKTGRIQTRQQTADILLHTQLLSLETQQRVVVLQIEKGTEEAVRKEQNFVTELERITEGLRRIATQNSALLEMNMAAYYRTAKSDGNLHSGIDKECAVLFQRFCRVQLEKGLLAAQQRSNTVVGLQDALLVAQAEHVDTLKQYAVLQQRFLEMQERQSGEPPRRAETRAPHRVDNAENDTTAFFDLTAQHQPQTRGEEAGALVLAAPRNTNAMVPALSNFSSELPLPRNFSFVGQEYVQAGHPIVIEMFLTFTLGPRREALRRYLEKPSTYVDHNKELKINIEFERMITDRIVHQLNRLDTDFSIPDNPTAVFKKKKEEEEARMTQVLFRFYKTFFARRLQFLTDLSENFGRSVPKLPCSFLELSQSSEENRRIKEMAQMAHNLLTLLNDVRNEYLDIKPPLDLERSYTTQIAELRAKLEQMYRDVSKKIGQISYPRDAIAVWERAGGKYPLDTLFQVLQRKPDSTFVAQSLKEQVSMWDYIQKLERDLLSLTFVEKTNYNAFFRTP